MEHSPGQDAFSFVTPRGETAQVSVRLYPAHPSARGCWLLLAHGAGAGQLSPFMVSYAGGLADRGVSVATFNFPYTEQGRRVPDPTGTLEACYLGAIRHVRERAGSLPLFIGGKSMGGRIASHVAATPGCGQEVVGLVFLGYPLHPPGRPDRPRTAHWPRLRVPTLFVQGSRDSFATPDELRAALPLLSSPAHLHLVEGTDHSLAVRRSGRDAQKALAASIQDAIVGWMVERLA